MVPVDLAQHDAALVGRAVAAEGLEHVEALAAWFLLQRLAGVLADQAVEGGVLAGLQLELDDDGDAGHAASLPFLSGAD
ncbi:hypothetical protein GCM10009416_42160 [Craurococcus roseus]|uniref:Uncharacterized protein n=1 Tax=Craurococcus roseus TaxID=77585 RepID=A0ABP3QXV2_9PROT